MVSGSKGNRPKKQTTSSPAEGANASGGPTPARKLLIADDDASLRRLVRATLESESYTILEAGDGVAALAQARLHRPDLILLDVKMPQMDGLKTCQALKRDDATRSLTVIMLTVESDPEDRKRALAAGADDYFTKPFSPMALIHKVEQVMGKRA